MKRFGQNNYMISTTLWDNLKMNRRTILCLSVCMLISFAVSIFFVHNVEILQGTKVVHFYLIIFDAGSAFSLFFRELFGLGLFLLLLGVLSLHYTLIPVVYVFFAYRGFAVAVLVFNLFAKGVFIGIAGIFFVLPFVLFNYFLLVLFGAFCISSSLYFRRCRFIDWHLLCGGFLVYLALIAAALLLELLLFLLVLRPFFGLL